MKRLSFLFSFVVMLLLCQAAWSATYYVDFTAGADSNAGTIGSPWKRCPGMVGWTGSATLSAGDTVYFDRGDTWTGGGGNSFIEAVGGVTYNGDTWGTGTRATLSATGTFSRSMLNIKSDHATYETEVGGFEVDGNGYQTSGANINWPSSTNLTGAIKRIRNCIIHDVAQTGGEATYGIKVGAIGGTEVHNVDISDNVIYNTSRTGLCLYPQIGCPSCIIRNSVIHGNEVYNTGGVGAGHGIMLKNYSIDSIVEENYCHDTSGSGIQLEDDGAPGPANAIVRNNIVASCDKAGIDVYNTANKSFVAYGNVIYENGRAGILFQSLGSAAITSRLVNNTIYHNPEGEISIEATSASFPFLVVKNNILASLTTYSPLNCPSSGKITDHSNNIYYRSSGGTLANVGGTSYTSTNITSYEGTALYSDPKFTDASGKDFTLLATSPAINVSGWLATITSDGNTGSSFVVSDARYFTDGIGIITGDVIQFEGTTTTKTITDINYTTNTITIDTPITWVKGQGISLEYVGAKPDVGAKEYDSGGSIVEGIEAPSTLAGVNAAGTITWTWLAPVHIFTETCSTEGRVLTAPEIAALTYSLVYKVNNGPETVKTVSGLTTAVAFPLGSTVSAKVGASTGGTPLCWTPWVTTVIPGGGIGTDVCNAATLSESNTTYNLTCSQTYSGTAFTMTGNNSTLDLKGYTITFGNSASGSGVVVSGTNNKVTNGKIVQGAYKSPSASCVFLGGSQHEVSYLELKPNGIFSGEAYGAGVYCGARDSSIHNVYVEHYGTVSGASYAPNCIFYRQVSSGGTNFFNNILVNCHRGLNIEQVGSSSSSSPASFFYNNLIQHKRTPGTKAPYGVSGCWYHGMNIHHNQIISDNGRGIIFDGCGNGNLIGSNYNTVSDNWIDIAYTQAAEGGAYPEDHITALYNRYGANHNTYNDNMIFVDNDAGAVTECIFSGSDDCSNISRQGDNVYDGNVCINHDTGSDAWVARLAVINSINIKNTQYQAPAGFWTGNWDYNNHPSCLVAPTLSNNTVLTSQSYTPAAPTGVKLRKFFDSYLVTWDMNIAESQTWEYIVYRDGVALNISPRAGRFYVDVNVSGSHTYAVKAKNLAGTISPLSASVSTGSASVGWPGYTYPMPMAKPEGPEEEPDLAYVEITASDTSLSEPANSGSVTVDCTDDPEFAGDDCAGLQVYYALTGIAPSPTTYSVSDSSPFTITSDAVPKTINFTIIDDKVWEEAQQSFSFNLTDTAGYDVGTVNTAQFAITDDDDKIIPPEYKPVIKITNSDASLSETGPDNGFAVITCTETQVGDCTGLVVPYAIVGVQPGGTSYTVSADSPLTIMNAATPYTLTFTTIDDEIEEEDQQFFQFVLAPSAEYDLDDPHTIDLAIVDDNDRITPKTIEYDGTNLPPFNSGLTIVLSGDDSLYIHDCVFNYGGITVEGSTGTGTITIDDTTINRPLSYGVKIDVTSGAVSMDGLTITGPTMDTANLQPGVYIVNAPAVQILNYTIKNMSGPGIYILEEGVGTIDNVVIGDGTIENCLPAIWILFQTVGRTSSIGAATMIESCYPDSVLHNASKRTPCILDQVTPASSPRTLGATTMGGGESCACSGGPRGAIGTSGMSITTGTTGGDSVIYQPPAQP